MDFSCTAKSRSFYFQIYFVDKIKTNHLHAVITLTPASTFSVTFNLQLMVYEDFGVGVIAIIMIIFQSNLFQMLQLRTMVTTRVEGERLTQINL